MSLGGFFLLMALIYALWTGLGWQKAGAMEWTALLRNTLLTLIVPMLLALYTVNESKLWAHLTYPPALIAWGVLLLVALAVGWAQLVHKQRAKGWPLLGLPLGRSARIFRFFFLKSPFC